jgi:hypothetical protein
MTRSGSLSGAFLAPNEAKIAPSETRRNGKPLKSLGAKSRDFAESFVFKGLIGFSFRRFREKLGAIMAHVGLLEISLRSS